MIFIIIIIVRQIDFLRPKESKCELLYDFPWKHIIDTHHFFTAYFYSKDVRLPVQLQRAMAAEAEAAREARAKVSITELPA